MRKMWMGAIPVAAAVALALVGCAKKSSDQPKANDAGNTPPLAAAAPSAPAGPTVTLSGTIHFEGTPPERKAIKMSADDACHKQHTEPALTEDVVVGAGGGLQNVFVSVQAGLEGKTFPVPPDTVTLDQKGCIYYPHVFGLAVNQPLRILNSDPTLHNVHAIPESGHGEFNKGMARQGMQITEFVKELGTVRFKCDVHPWMQSWGHVMSHPYFGVTDNAGSYKIANLPPGEYTIQAWHEKLGSQTAKLTVTADGATPTLDFTFKAAAGS